MHRHRYSHPPPPVFKGKLAEIRGSKESGKAHNHNISSSGDSSREWQQLGFFSLLINDMKENIIFFECPEQDEKLFKY